MEKRLVLSFVLSFLVLYVWATLAPKPDKKAPLSDNNPIIQPTESVQDSVPNIEISEIEPLVQEKNEDVEEEVFTLENDKFILKFSSNGGNFQSAYLKEYKSQMPVTHITSVAEFDDYAFSLNNRQEKSLEFTYQDDAIRIVKVYSIADDYTLETNMSIENLSKMSKKMKFNVKGFTLNMENEDQGNGKVDQKQHQSGLSAGRDRGLNEYAISSKEGIQRKNNAYKFSEKDQKSVKSELNWIGFRNRYYCLLSKPEFSTLGYQIENKSEKQLDVVIDAGQQVLEPNNPLVFSSVSYIGPEKIELLKKYEYGFENVQRYYKFGVFDGIAKLINWLMRQINKFIPNWGLCIIVISIIIYYSMYPLTAKGMSSMKKMQALQPKIQSLKEKYEKNPQKLNQEMLELYRKEKINPLGGCFPILLQMPVFIGLYQVLWRNVDFKGAQFLWMKDLSVPDRLFVLDFSLPIIGNEINLLPLLMMVIMFFQQKFSAKNMTVTDPMQLQQQKMMATIMPLFLGFIFYKFASGLTLYFTMFYIFSTLTQWKISKQPKVV